MRTLGLDVGSKTIGLALSDAGGQIATALGVLRRQGMAKDTAAILGEVDKHQVQAVVIGHPLELDGVRGPRAIRVEAFVNVLRAGLEAAGGKDVPLHLWDERFSTAAAERTLLEADVSRAKRKTKIDGLAAQFILQGWLDSRKNQGMEVDL